MFEKAIFVLRRRSEIIALITITFFYGVATAVGASWLTSAMNIAGPVMVTGTLMWSCYQIVQSSPIAIWAPLFWFRLCSAVYYGLGALIPNFVNDSTWLYMATVYRFDAQMQLKVNFIYAAGVTLVLAFSYAFLNFNNSRSALQLEQPEYRPNKGNFSTIRFAIFFLIVGAIIRYGYSVPYTMGLLSFVLPGAINILSNAYYVGIYLLTSYASVNRKVLLIPIFILASFDAIISITSFEKTQLIILVIFVFLGLLSSGATRRKLALGSLAVLLTYFLFQPLVIYGRDSLQLRYGSISGANISERLGIVKSYLDGERHSSSSNIQFGILRLSYVNVSAFLVRQYDSGNPGHTLRDAASVFVPRVIWPDKPVITQLGADLNILVRGRDGSAMGAGHFAEAYWNFGWWGFPPFMLVVAAILAAFSRFSLRVMSRGDWIFLPVVFMGVNMGLRIDGHFVPDMLGTAWIALCIGTLLFVIKALLSPRIRRRVAFAPRQLNGFD